jgi:uncharacterized protein
VLIRAATPPGADNCCAFAIMAKASRPGVTKTRLSPPLTPDQAAALNTAFLMDTNENLALAGRSAKLARFMSFGPARAGDFFQALMGEEVGLLEASYPDLGKCLRYTIHSLLDLGYGMVCVLNSDSPSLPTALLLRAIADLNRPGDRMVLGPCTDGGYYLMGVKRAHDRLFEDIDWSTTRVAEQTMHRAAELGLETVVLPPWFDVDEVQALRLLEREALDGHSISPDWRPYSAPHSAALLRSFSQQIDGPS